MIHVKPGVGKAYPVITICGSMRFYDLMLTMARRYTTKGYIVLMPHNAEYIGNKPTDGIKNMLNHMHLVKIDMSDAILVVADSTHYIGDSTLSEMAYANAISKPIFYSWEDSIV